MPAPVQALRIPPRTPICHCEISAHTGCGNLVQATRIPAALRSFVTEEYAAPPSACLEMLGEKIAFCDFFTRGKCEFSVALSVSYWYNYFYR